MGMSITEYENCICASSLADLELVATMRVECEDRHERYIVSMLSDCVEYAHSDIE